MNPFIETNKGIIELEDGWLLIIRFHEDIVLDVDDIKELIESGNKLAKGQPHATLALPENRTSATHDAMKYARTSQTLGRYAEASVVKSLSTRLLSKFYHAVIKPPIPSRYFGNEEAARDWLKEQKQLQTEEQKHSA